MTKTLRGASAADILDAVETTTSLSGLDGFAGELPDRRLVRDVLGREPLFTDHYTREWSFTPTDLANPTPVPPGTIRAPSDDQPTQVWTLPQSDPSAESAALDQLRDAVDGALTQVDDIPIAFSGGVDSSLLTVGSQGPLYVVGFPGSTDREAAESAADLLGRELRTVSMDVDSIERVIPEVAQAINRVDAMSVAIAIPLYLLGRAIAADGFDRVALGQGADELFAGYEKLVSPAEDDRIAADATLPARDLMLDSIADQATRDVLALRHAGVDPVCPWLGDALVKAALHLPSSMLATEQERKIGFRRVAGEYLPAELATRQKRAVQYGTLTAREVDRLAREAGFKRRIGDHVTKYIRARVETVDEL